MNDRTAPERSRRYRIRRAQQHAATLERIRALETQVQQLTSDTALVWMLSALQGTGRGPVLLALHRTLKGAQQHAAHLEQMRHGGEAPPLRWSYTEPGDYGKPHRAVQAARYRITPRALEP